MDRIRLPLAALALSVLVACESAGPTAVPTPETAPPASNSSSDTPPETAERGGNLIGSGT